MNFADALAWLHGTQAFGVKLGLENTRRLLAAAGDPHRRLRFIHVAGTNGKGSTCAMIDAILRAAGMRAGLYTSPHLVDFRERMRVNGEMIGADDVAEGLTLLHDASEDWDHSPTFFEFATVLAAWWFDRAGASAVVWETGMGGRHDATNAVDPEVVVITPVGMDHAKWLGGTLREIAGEKAGIIKPGVPVVCAPQRMEAREVIERKAAEAGAPLHAVTEPWEGALALAGAHQRWNAAAAAEAARIAGPGLDPSAVASGLAGVAWPGRFQVLDGRIVLDGAHNPEAMEALTDTWRGMFGARRARVVFSALADKDVPALLAPLRSVADEICIVPLASPRGADAAELERMALLAGFAQVRRSSLADALRGFAPDDAPLLVTGSLFLVGEALAVLGGLAPPRVSAQ